MNVQIPDRAERFQFFSAPKDYLPKKYQFDEKSVSKFNADAILQKVAKLKAINCFIALHTARLQFKIQDYVSISTEKFSGKISKKRISKKYFEGF